MSRLVTPAALGLVLGLAALAAAPAFAQPAAPPPPPSKDPMAAPAGTYKLDKDHESIVARVGHGGGKLRLRGAELVPCERQRAGLLRRRIDQRSLDSLLRLGTHVGQRHLQRVHFAARCGCLDSLGADLLL